ncbi:hypothetical protein [Actinoplanes auranticolor]|uniref:Uncharacterized protein n=1 Tax=Actinoplanes auranticolor TaxID=47988 RepID=A0A919SAJ4_9ACTN|nr:hypothetical protein [Actinoplanes auranticolor]GIM67953.1 hypothetical protein Aau02nite_29550 [Actinoplanes auranticolor]
MRLAGAAGPAVVPEVLAAVPVLEHRRGTMTARERVTYRLGVAAAAADGRTDLAATVRLCPAMREARARR